MLNDAKDLQAVYIVCGYTDLRKGIDSLSNIISQTYGMDPFQPGTLFMFCGRKTWTYFKVVTLSSSNRSNSTMTSRSSLLCFLRSSIPHFSFMKYLR